MLIVALCSVLASSAFAGDATPDTITAVPAGTVVTLPKAAPFTTQGQAYLLPEAYYNEALLQAKELRICQPALERCTTMATDWIGVAESALGACKGQFDTDEATIEALRKQVQDEEMRRMTAEQRLHDVRVQRNTAWAITGGLVLGAVAVTAVAIGS